MTITQADREAAALVQAIVDAGQGYSINLTRLVDGEVEYTLTYRGETSVHESYDDALDALRGLEEAEKTRAATEFLKQFRIAALEEAACVADDFAAAMNAMAKHPDPLPIDTNEGWRRVMDGALDIATAIRNLAGEE